MAFLPKLLSNVSKVFLLLFCFLMCGCRSWRSNATPSITFAKIPPAVVGGSGKVGEINGHVTGALEGQQIVMYTRSLGLWWVQPFANQPFTKIQNGSTWSGQIHLGPEYAALLVDSSYQPLPRAENLPAVGNGVIAVATTKGEGPAPAEYPKRTIHFSGFDWAVRNEASDHAGVRNAFDPANVSVDDQGALHLRMAKSGDGWTSGEVKLTRALGYGTYVFVLRDISHLEPSAVFALFTWDGTGTEQNRRELDIELGRWGHAKNDNAQYVVQPYYVPTNVLKFTVPAGVQTHAIHWQPGQVTFTTRAGAHEGAEGPVLSQHEFTSGVPAPSGDLVRMSFFNYNKGEVPLENESEIVVEKFAYFP
jgi:hypothetical protein